MKRKQRRQQKTGSSLADSAYEQIKKSLLLGRLRAGEYLNVARLCAELELGRQPVHQALHRLALEDLVEIVPRKGIVIRADSFDHWLQINEARAILAPILAGLAAQRADGQAISRMDRILAGMRTARDREALLLADLAFHAELFGAAGNTVLGRAALRHHERALRLLLLRTPGKGEREQASDGLAAVLLAIRNGDPAAAQTAMRAYAESGSIGWEAAAARRSAVA